MDRFDDICEAKALARTNDPQTSKDAAEKMVKSGALSRQEKEVLDNIHRFMRARAFYFEELNFTAKELYLWSGLNYHLIQRRLSGLEDKGKIDVVWERLKIKRRDDCRVWRLL